MAKEAPIITDPYLGAGKHEDDDFVASPEERGDNFVGGGEGNAQTPVVEEEKPAEELAQEPSEQQAQEPAEESPAADEAEDGGEEPEQKPEEKPAKEEKPAEKKEEPAAKKKDGKSKSVPYDRFKAVNDRLRESNQRLADLQRQQQAQADAKQGEYDFEAKEAEYIDLVLEGKKTEAAQLRKEIRAAESEVYKATATAAAEQAVPRVNAQRTVKEMTNQAEQDYAEFDPDSDEYNEELVDDVKAQFQGYVRAGRFTPVEAIRKAIDNVVKLNGLAKIGGDEEIAAEERPAQVTNVLPSKKDVKAKVAAAKKQPPPSHKAGTSGASGGQNSVKVEQLSDEEFNALPAATIARLRGDVLTS